MKLAPTPGKVRLSAGRTVQSSLIGYKGNKLKEGKKKKALRFSSPHSACSTTSLKHKTIKSTFTFFPSPLRCPFLLRSREPKPGFHQHCEEAVRRLTQRIGHVQFQSPPGRKKKKKHTKQAIFMISTSHYSVIPLPVSDKYGQLLRRSHPWDRKMSLVPPRQPHSPGLGGAGSEHPAPSLLS